MADQMVLSDRVKAAMKTALAMVLAYGVALSMDWDNPYWAGFAVAFCSLSTVGESLNKGLLRLSGTLLGGLSDKNAKFMRGSFRFASCCDQNLKPRRGRRCGRTRSLKSACRIS